MSGKKRSSTRLLPVAAVVLGIIAAGCVSDPVKRGMDCLELGDYQMAREFFSTELRKNPRHFDARVGMGKAFIQEAWAEQPDSVLLRKALVHLEAARSIEDRPALNTLLAEAWLLYATMKAAHGDTLAALTALTFSLDHDPEEVDALNLAGALYGAKGYTHRADSLFQRAATRDSTNQAVLFNLGMLHWHLGQFDQAAEYWRRCVALDGDDKQAAVWLARARTRAVGETGHE